jgi:hypothetical protein
MQDQRRFDRHGGVAREVITLLEKVCSACRLQEPLFDYLVEHGFGHKPIPSLQN